MGAHTDQHPISPLPPSQFPKHPSPLSKVQFWIFLHDVQKDISLLWLSIWKAWPALNSLLWETYLVQLGCFFQKGGDPPAFCEKSNIISVPLAVVSQIVNFWKTKDHINCFHFSEGPAKRPPLLMYKGSAWFFDCRCRCMFAQYWSVENFSSKAVYLAVCTGAAVDFDELDTSSRGCSIAIW